MEVVGEGFGPFGHVGHGIEVAVAGLVDLRRRGPAAIVVGIGIQVRPVIRPFEVGLVGVLLVDDQRPLVDRLGRCLRPGFRLAARHIRRRGPTGRLIEPRLIHLEGLVVLDLLLDPLLERHHRQLQDLHRLDHARRKHLLLRHPHFLAERHPHG